MPGERGAEQLTKCLVFMEDSSISTGSGWGLTDDKIVINVRGLPNLSQLSL